MFQDHLGALRIAGLLEQSIRQLGGGFPCPELGQGLRGWRQLLVWSVKLAFGQVSRLGDDVRELSSPKNLGVFDEVSEFLSNLTVLLNYELGPRVGC